MFPSDKKNEEQYNQLMQVIKRLNYERRIIIKSSGYAKGKKIESFKRANLAEKIKIVGTYSARKIHPPKNKEIFFYKDLETAYNDREICNYVSKERIAVYTCIVGTYDRLQEPLIKPDNIDYYAVTDFDIPKDSKWIRIPIDKFEIVKDYSPALCNRFFKMHPHLLFKEYKYSIYIDGNIRIYSDLTEHVNRLSECGLSSFRHARRKCVYDEAVVCKDMGKETVENIAEYVKRLKEEEFPTNIGVLQCSFLVREHNKESCIKIMELWWDEFKTYVKRDQLSLPFVLYKRGIKVDEVATLGGTIHKDYSIEIIPHSIQ